MRLFADYVKKMCLSACHTYSTIIFLHSTNHTIACFLALSLRCRYRLLLKLPTVPCWRTPTTSYDFGFQKSKCLPTVVTCGYRKFTLSISNFRLRMSDNLHTDFHQHSWMSTSKNKATQIYAASRSHILSGCTQRKHPQNERENKLWVQKERFWRSRICKTTN